MKKLESSFLNMVVVLTTITLISALGLGAMYNATEEPIKQAKKAKQEAAIKDVLPEFASVDTAIIVNDQKVFKAYDANNQLVGMAIETVGLGFGGNVKTMVGIDANGRLVNYSILEHSETPGLGSKLVDWFKVKSDIRGADVSSLPLTVSKDGGEYDAITAATISSRAFLKSINVAYDTYKECMSQNNDKPAISTQSVDSVTIAADSTALSTDSVSLKIDSVSSEKLSEDSTKLELKESTDTL